MNMAIDETENIHLDINDALLANAKLQAYNVGQQAKDEQGKDVPVNPKKFPTKAVDIIFPAQNLLVEVFLDTESKKWSSKFFKDGVKCQLSPDQMGQFFDTQFYTRLAETLKSKWPLSDELYGSLYEGIQNREMLIDCGEEPVTEDDKEKKKPTRTKSGRKIMNFNDSGVKYGTTVFTCWPQKGKEFRWSQWRDWTKIKPLCRMRLEFANDHQYTMSINVIGKLYKHRGFKVCDITQQPPVQWLTMDETHDFMKLSIVDKFTRFCANRIHEYANMDPEEVFKKIDAPEKITVEDIRKTQLMIRKTLNEIIQKQQADDYKWTN